MRAIAGQLADRGLTVHVAAGDQLVLAVPARVVTALAGAVREALSNVAAHARTAEAWVTVSLTAADAAAGIPGGLRVTARDQGIGFDPARAGRGRLGLRRSIAERAADCGGQASVWSRPGQGTVVTLSWPGAGQLAAPERP